MREAEEHVDLQEGVPELAEVAQLLEQVRAALRRQLGREVRVVVDGLRAEERLLEDGADPGLHLRLHHQVDGLALEEEVVVGGELELGHIDAHGGAQHAVEALRRHDEVARDGEPGVERVLDGLCVCGRTFGGDG